MRLNLCVIHPKLTTCLGSSREKFAASRDNCTVREA